MRVTSSLAPGSEPWTVAIAAELLASGVRRSTGTPSSRLDYRIADVVELEHSIDLELTQGTNTARLEVDLPGAGRAQFWIYATPTSARDWVGQLLTWIDEQMYTGGLTQGVFARRDVGSKSYLIVEPYGFRSADPDRHAKLSSSVGPDGWHSDIADRSS